MAQIKDLVERNCIRQEENGVAYQFTDKNKVKTVYLSEKVRLSVVNGRTGIVKIDNTYELVPAEIAKKILERSAESVIVLLEPTSELIAEDDPYANYQVPDDLIW